MSSRPLNLFEDCAAVAAACIHWFPIFAHRLKPTYHTWLLMIRKLMMCNSGFPYADGEMIRCTTLSLLVHASWFPFSHCSGRAYVLRLHVKFNFIVMRIWNFHLDDFCFHHDWECDLHFCTIEKCISYFYITAIGYKRCIFFSFLFTFYNKRNKNIHENFRLLSLYLMKDM